MKIYLLFNKGSRRVLIWSGSGLTLNSIWVFQPINNSATWCWSSAARCPASRPPLPHPSAASVAPSHRRAQEREKKERNRDR